MITKITTQYFKRFESQEFLLEPLTLLAGPKADRVSMCRGH